MRIVGGVAPEEVPDDGERNSRDRLWVSLVRRAIAEHREGRVLKVELDDREELKRLRNGTMNYWRKEMLKMVPVVDDKGATLVVYLELTDLAKPEPISRRRRQRQANG